MIGLTLDFVILEIIQMQNTKMITVMLSHLSSIVKQRGGIGNTSCPSVCPSVQLQEGNIKKGRYRLTFWFVAASMNKKYSLQNLGCHVKIQDVCHHISTDIMC